MKLLRALLLGLALFSASTATHAQARGAAAATTARASRTRQYTATAGRNLLLNRFRARGVTHYTRTLPNGAQRVVAHVDGAHLPVVTAALDEHSNVLEILHSGKAGAFHTMGLFDRKLEHTQVLTGTSNWRLRSWGDSIHMPDVPLYSASIQLTASEAGKLRTLLSAAHAEQGPENLAGPNWANGHLTAGLGKRSINCVSTWSEMAIGDNGETVAQLVGLHQSYSGNPPGFQKALENEANERVIGLTVYGRTAPAGFGTNHDAPVFRQQ